MTRSDDTQFRIELATGKFVVDEPVNKFGQLIPDRRIRVFVIAQPDEIRFSPLLYGAPVHHRQADDVDVIVHIHLKDFTLVGVFKLDRVDVVDEHRAFPRQANVLRRNFRRRGDACFSQFVPICPVIDQVLDFKADGIAIRCKQQLAQVAQIRIKNESCLPTSFTT